MMTDAGKEVNDDRLYYDYYTMCISYSLKQFLVVNKMSNCVSIFFIIILD